MKTHLDDWSEMWYQIRRQLIWDDEAWRKAWHEACEAILLSGRKTAVWHARNDVAWMTQSRINLDVYRGIILALIAYDDCAHMLEFTPEQIHLYVCLGVPGAILLEPAVMAMNNE